jgi:hypothetical protein
MNPFSRRPFPRRFGGGINHIIVEHTALLDSLKLGYDVSEDQAVYAEAYAHAIAIVGMWRINGRLRNFLVPSKMMESLPVWEESCHIRPEPGDTPQQRRRVMGAHFLGFHGNLLVDLENVCRAAGGANFIQINGVDTPDMVDYWPGINPGPPGFEWMSTRHAYSFVLTSTGMDARSFNALVRTINREMTGLLPSHMIFKTGTGVDGFIVDIGIVDLTLIGP